MKCGAASACSAWLPWTRLDAKSLMPFDPITVAAMTNMMISVSRHGCALAHGRSPIRGMPARDAACGHAPAAVIAGGALVPWDFLSWR